MKKLLCVVACFALLAGCSTAVSIDQTFDIPEKVQAAIQPERGPADKTQILYAKEIST